MEEFSNRNTCNGLQFESKAEILAMSRSIKEWPKSERPRERLLSQGAGALSDAELLAVILRNGVRGKINEPS